MLSINIAEGSSFMINDDIQVIIKKIKGKSIQVLIDAPDDVAVWRRELWAKMPTAVKTQSTKNKNKRRDTLTLRRKVHD